MQTETLSRKWPARVLRLLGALNLAYGVAGLCMIGVWVYYTLAAYPPNTPDKPYWRHFYFAMTSLNVVFLSALFVAGTGLLRLQRRAVTLCYWLFPIEVLYYAGMGFFYDSAVPLSRPIIMSVTAAMRHGDDGILPQMVTGYPFLALLALGWARRNYFSDGSPCVPVRKNAPPAPLQERSARSAE